MAPNDLRKPIYFVLSVTDTSIKIITPIDDTPAAKAGVMPGDYITHINGESIQGQSLQEGV